MGRQLLILDIDETLVFASEQPLAHSPDIRVGPFSVYKRPHLEHFLRVVFEQFDVAVWTSSSEDYAEAVLASVFFARDKLKFVWARSRCTRRYDAELQTEHWIKDLKKVARLGYRLEQVLVVDDSPEKLQRQYGNHIRVTPFVGDPGDRELEMLLPFLDYIATVENVRLVEKRGWRSFRS